MSSTRLEAQGFIVYTKVVRVSNAVACDKEDSDLFGVFWYILDKTLKPTPQAVYV